MDIEVLEGVFDANEKIARENEELLRRHGVLAVNLMASPGAGKTSLVIRTLELLREKLRIGVIEGDIASSVDSEKVRSHGVPVVQINTGGACHLDAIMIRQALDHLDLGSLDLVIIENVGNLVCPAEFKLGEGLRAMILSVAEGWPRQAAEISPHVQRVRGAGGEQDRPVGPGGLRHGRAAFDGPQDEPRHGHLRGQLPYRGRPAGLGGMAGGEGQGI